MLWTLTGLLYMLGGLLFGIATFRAGILPRWAAGLLAVGSALAPVAALLPPEHQPKVAVPVGFALAWLGYALWSERRAHASNPVPGTASPQLRPPQPSKFVETTWSEQAVTRPLVPFTTYGDATRSPDPLKLYAPSTPRGRCNWHQSLTIPQTGRQHADVQLAARADAKSSLPTRPAAKAAGSYYQACLRRLIQAAQAALVHMEPRPSGRRRSERSDFASALNSLLFKSRLVPRPLAILGLIGATLVLGYGMLVCSASLFKVPTCFMLLALPIAIYEMILRSGRSPRASTPRLAPQDRHRPQPASFWARHSVVLRKQSGLEVIPQTLCSAHGRCLYGPQEQQHEGGRLT